MLKDLDTQRRESRFLLHNDSREALTETLVSLGFQVAAQQESERTLLQTFYAGQRNTLPESVLMRYRVYNGTSSPESIFFPTEANGILEIKSSPEAAVTFKAREQLPARAVLEGIAKPDDFYRVVERGRTMQELGIQERDVDLFFQGIDMREPLSMLMATETWRTYFTDANTRITLDEGMRYFGFFPGELIGSVIGHQPLLRGEIKCSDQHDQEKILTSLHSLGAKATDSGKRYLLEQYATFIETKR